MRSLPAALLSGVVAVLMATHADCADTDYAAPGSFTVRQADQTWRDDARQRDIPVRIRLPQSSAPVPAILFSHGLGGSVGGGTEWAEQ